TEEPSTSATTVTPTQTSSSTEEPSTSATTVTPTQTHISKTTTTGTSTIQ
ncbi:integumentary mucin C.1-like, partial [Centropristis striata]